MMILFRARSLFVLSALALTACNSGGGDSSPGTSTTTQNTSPVVPVAPVVLNEVATDFKSDCDIAVDASCGSKTNSIYAGNGAGIYKYTNNTNSSVTVNLGINGINAKNVYLVYSNPTNNDVVLADGSGVGIKEVSDKFKIASVADVQTHSDVIAPPDISKLLAGQNKKILSATPVTIPTYEVGTLRQQYNGVDYQNNYPVMNTVLATKKQFTNGSWLYVWVDTSVQIDSQLINEIADTYVKKGGIFDTLTAMSGELVIDPKDKNMLFSLISPLIKDQHVIFTKITGFLENTTGSYNPISEYSFNDVSGNLKSNRQHEIYVSSDIFTRYNSTPDIVKQYVLNTMAHETQHELTFLNKALKNDVNVGSAFNEFASVMAENVNSSIQKDNMMSTRLPHYLSTNNCPYIHDYISDKSEPTCSYSTYTSSYVVGAYLLRKYGAEFLGDFTKSPANSFDELDKFIKTYNAKDSLADVIQKVSAIPLLKDKTFGAYSYPQKQTNYLLDSLSYTTFSTMLKFKTVPSTLKSMSSVIQDLGIVNSALMLQSNTPFQKYVTVPAGATVTAVVN